MKLYATVENSKGKAVKIGDNEHIAINLYQGNKKLYTLNVYYENVGDIEKPEMSTIITYRDWRIEEQTIDTKAKKQKDDRICQHGKSLFYECCNECNYCTKNGIITKAKKQKDEMCNCGDIKLPFHSVGLHKEEYENSVFKAKKQKDEHCDDCEAKMLYSEGYGNYCPYCWGEGTIPTAKDK